MGNITRRDFLKIGAGAVAMTLLPKFFLGSENNRATGSLIGVAHGEKSKLVKAAIDAIGGIEKFIDQEDQVLIKPNISFAANSEWGATTNADIVRQLVQLCLDAGAKKIVIIDYPLANAELCLEKSGIESATVDKQKVSILMLSKERQFTEVEVPDGKEITSVKIAKELKKADKFINFPVAKTHSATGVSIGLKNLMGVIWDRGIFHQVNIHQAIAELATVVKPHLTLVDATKVLTSGGPGGPGKTVALDKVIAGVDVVAVDSYAVGITPWYNKSFKGSSVKHIAAAAGLGLGEIDTEKMIIKEVDV